MIVASMYLLYKNALETCLECLKRLEERIGPQAGLTYAGRLDPLASGLLIVLDSGELAKKQEIMALSKVYEFDVVFGIGTDTFDQFGIIYPNEAMMTWQTLNFGEEKLKNIVGPLKEEFEKGIQGDRNKITDVLKELCGSAKLFYPFFSSKPIDGKPLFQYTMENGVEKTNLVLPSREVELINIECLSIREISTKDLTAESIQIAQVVRGDFRQKAIVDSWENLKIDDAGHSIWSLRISCGSGFYVRSLAVWLGQILGKGAMARNIKRVSIGEYKLEDVEL